MSEQNIRAILDQGASFKGLLSFEGAVRIAGCFEGEINSPKGTLIIEPTAQVKAQAKVRVLVLSGRLEGDIQALEQVFMYPPAHFTGKVQSPSLKIEEGVIFEGSSFHAKKNS